MLSRGALVAVAAVAWLSPPALAQHAGSQRPAAPVVIPETPGGSVTVYRRGGYVTVPVPELGPPPPPALPPPPLLGDGEPRPDGYQVIPPRATAPGPPSPDRGYVVVPRP